MSAGARERVRDAQQRAQRRAFVGRQTEIDGVLRSLRRTKGAPRVFYLHGLGGIGKTALLEQLAAHAKRSGARVTVVDAREMTATPDAFHAHALAFPTDRPHLLLVDTVEAIRPLDRWLRETFLPALPIGVVTVLATRDAPSADWRSVRGWGRLFVELRLDNLTTNEAEELLERRRVPLARHREAVEFTHGHPLALVLVSELTLRRGEPLRPEREPELVRGLLRRFLDEIDAPAHRRAVECAAVVRTLTEPLLAALLGGDPRAAFTWLRERSFMQSGPFGLFPHDVVREAVVAELRWRDPPTYATLIERAHTFFATKLAASEGDRDPRIAGDHVYLSRFVPGIGEILRGVESPGLRAEVATESDVPALLALVAKHEGKASAAIAARWFDRQLDRVVVVRAPKGGVAGFVAHLALERASPEDLEADPAASAAWTALRSLGRLRKRDAVSHFRFWMAKGSYQEPSDAQAICMQIILHRELTTPNVVRSFWPCRHAEMFADLARHGGSERMPEADFTVGGRRYGVYSHDWRHRSPAAWLAEIAKAASGGASAPAPTPLDERGFRDAVPAALKSFASDYALAQSPLAGARIVTDRVSAGEVELDAIRNVLRAAIAALGSTSRGRKLATAVAQTYFGEPTTQEAAAEALSLPFSTYRRHLTSALDAIAEWLWANERTAAATGR